MEVIYVELLEGIETRRSLRAFKPSPVSEGVMDKILKAASRSPSYTNTQPWEVAVVSGQKKDELSKILCDMVGSGIAPSPDIPLPKKWPLELDRRSKDHGRRRFAAIGIKRENEQQRKEMRILNFKFYGAPSVIFLFMDSTLGGWSIFDMGLFAQTLILAAHSFGVGSCLQASVVGYPDVIRDFLGIPKAKHLLLGISMGYPDLDARINTYQSTRISLDDFVQICA
jgi:nitroreductase